MRCRKVLEQPAQEHAIRKELQYLYDRRSAVEMAIRSLEHYDRFRANRELLEKQKTA